jgi:hypothetical protein
MSWTWLRTQRWRHATLPCIDDLTRVRKRSPASPMPGSYVIRAQSQPKSDCKASARIRRHLRRAVAQIAATRTHRCFQRLASRSNLAPTKLGVLYSPLHARSGFDFFNRSNKHGLFVFTRDHGEYRPGYFVPFDRGLCGTCRNGGALRALRRYSESRRILAKPTQRRRRRRSASRLANCGRFIPLTVPFDHRQRLPVDDTDFQDERIEAFDAPEIDAVPVRRVRAVADVRKDSTGLAKVVA